MCKPEEPIDKANALMKQVMSEAQEARRYSISLKQHQLSDKLVADLAMHADRMERLYQAIQTLVMSKANAEQSYQKHFEYAAKSYEWFTQKAELARACESAIKLKKAKAAAQP